MDVVEFSLAELRTRLREAQGEPARRRLIAALAGDSRAGARALAAAAARGRVRERADRRRLAALFARRRRLFARGALRVAGVDEVGVGPLAGPVVAAAVVLPAAVDLPGLDDSKRLTAAARGRIAAAIREQALSFAVAEIGPETVDRMNVYRAALEAMGRAVRALDVVPDHLLVDARTLPGVDVAQTAVVGGDAQDGSIAAASILAKVHRDALMRRLDGVYPGYGLARNKGYGTPEHLAALRRLGPCAIHRRSFAPVAQLPLL